MKTDDFISMLCTNVERVDRRELAFTLGAAIVVAIVFAFGATIVILGLRADPTGAEALTYLPLKLVFTVGTVVLTWGCLVMLARPGGEYRAPVALLVLPFLAVAVMAAIDLASTPHTHWHRMLIGDRWLECLLSIPLIAVLPLALIVWAVRRTAPTDLVRAGALSGLLAGGVSAMAYALHCTDDSLPFVALWYSATIVLCTIAGAIIGPRALRW